MVHLALLLWICVTVLFSFSAAQQDCRYTYVKQPVTQLQCNPHLEDRINLQCIVEGPSEEVVNIPWFRQTLGNDQAELVVEGGGVVIISFQGLLRRDGTIERGSIMRLSPLTEEDIGQYWCVVRVNNVTVLERSNVLNLTSEQSYNGLDECDPINTGDYTTDRRACADLPSSTSPTAFPTTGPSVNPAATKPGILVSSTANFTTTTTVDTTATPYVNPTNESTFIATTTEPEIQESSTVDIPAATTKDKLTPFSTTTPSVSPTNEPTSITTATEPERTNSQSTVDITAATTVVTATPSVNLTNEPTSISTATEPWRLWSVVAATVVVLAVIMTTLVAVIIIIRRKAMTRKAGRENEPTAAVFKNPTYDDMATRIDQDKTGAHSALDHEYEGACAKSHKGTKEIKENNNDHEENDVQHDYETLPRQPTDNSGTKLESGIYDMPVLDHDETGVTASFKYDYADSHLPINKPQNHTYASGNRSEDIPKKNKSYAKVHKGTKEILKENKSYARVHRPTKCSAKENKKYAQVHRPANGAEENKSYARVHRPNNK